MVKPAYEIATLPGDGIGPEVVEATVAVLDAAVGTRGFSLQWQTFDAGAGMFRRTGVVIAPETMAAVGEADAILLGAMGLPDVRTANGTEAAPQLDIRERYQLFASLRPARLFDGVEGVLRRGDVDMLVIRETTEGLFAGRHEPPGDDPDSASNVLTITRATSEKLFELAFAQARLRRAAGHPGKVTLLDKSNVLHSFAFFRSVFDDVAARHPDVESERLYIDAASMLMVLDPGRFDVIVTENQFGDIVSELAAGISGGIGLAPSADVGEGHAVFQPCHGSAPDLVGRGLANPVATILSGAMLLEWLSDRHEDPRAADAATELRAAVAEVLAAGPRTPDLGGSATTDEVTRAIIAALPRS